MYQRRSRLSPRLQSRLIEHFVAGSTARVTSEITGVNVKTVTKFFMRLRYLIASKNPSFDLSHEVEAGDNCLSESKIRRCQACKVALFGLLKRGGKVYTAIIPNASTERLLPILKEKVALDSIVYTEAIKSYRALYISDFYYRPIGYSAQFSEKTNNISWIDNFLNQAKRHLRKFNGIKRENFYWFLKECEWRFNGGNHQQLLRKLKYWYKNSKH